MSIFDVFKKRKKDAEPAPSFVPHYGPNGYVKLAVAGVMYYADSIDQLKKDNPVYDLPDKDLRASVSGSVSRYTFPRLSCRLELDPENAYDPNAVRVLANGLPVGYVMQTESAWVASLIRANNIERVGIELSGGPSKLCFGREVTVHEAPFTGRIFIKPRVAV